jgi:hypothetical protein
MKTVSQIFFFSFLLFSFTLCKSQDFIKEELLYSNPLSSNNDTIGWKMEGKGQIEFANEWMKMFSHKEKGHHVFWCPQEFPNSYIAEWEVQNLNTKVGLCIVFFSAKGLKGESIFDTSLPKRDGTFKQYTKSVVNNYHISYYANSKDHPRRETSHLRKNKGFHLVQEKEKGIPISSKEIHKIRLVKFEGRIQLFVDERNVIDWLDNGQDFGEILEGGKIGFRQMKWTQFKYRNFHVWQCRVATQ